MIAIGIERGKDIHIVSLQAVSREILSLQRETAFPVMGVDTAHKVRTNYSTSPG
jgi:hypothetical protein